MHRLAYCDALGIDIGAIDGMVIRHRCDNERCINAEHLEIGTQADNIADMWERTRVPPHQEHYDAIRTEYVRGSKECGQVALATKYGLSQSHVSRIIRSELL